jgi:hypothetical protein
VAINHEKIIWRVSHSTILPSCQFGVRTCLPIVYPKDCSLYYVTLRRHGQSLQVSSVHRVEFDAHEAWIEPKIKWLGRHDSPYKEVAEIAKTEYRSIFK